MRIRSRIFILCVLMVRTAYLAAQTAEPTWNIDASVGMISSAPSSDFGSVPGIASPGNLRYNPLSGATRMMASLGSDVPVYRGLRVGLRLDMQSILLRYDALERAPIAIEGGGLAIATLRHNLQTSFTLAGLVPYLRYEPTSWLSVGAALPLVTVTESRFTQTMVFADPPGLRFVDGSLEQVTARGDVPNRRSVIPMVMMFAEANIPVSPSGSWVLVPRLGVSQGLSSITVDGAFNLRSFTAGIGIRYRLGRSVSAPPKVDVEPAPIVPPPAAPLSVRVERDTFVELTRGIAETMTMLMNTAIDTLVERTDDGTDRRIVRRRETYRMAVPKPPSVLRAALQLQFVDEDGEVTRDARLAAVRVESRRTVSFVPAVVFDNASSQIPLRYVQLTSQQSRSWTEASVGGSAVSTHWQYQVLNVIGSRMKRLPSTTCTLTVAADGASQEVSSARCAAVRSYLASRFGISESRLQSRVVPRGDDNSAVPAGAVFIDPASSELLAPVEFTVSTIETQLPRVQLVPDVISESGVRSWSIDATQDAVSVRTFSGSGTLPTSIPWDMNEDIVADAAFRKPIVLTLHVEDIDDARTQSDAVSISLTSRLPLSSASRPVKRTEVFSFGRDGGTRQSSALSQVASGARPLAEWTTRGLDAAERAMYERRGMRLSVQVLERR